VGSVAVPLIAVSLGSKKTSTTEQTISRPIAKKETAPPPFQKIK
jgi:hypothetical protein